MANQVVLLWLAALPLMASPGPAVLSVAGVGTAFGLRRALPYYGGIVAGTHAVMALIAAGVTSLILAEPALVGVLTGLACAYILYLAWKIASAPVGAVAVADRPAPGFLPGFLLAVSNPKAFAVFGALYSGHTVIAGDRLADTAAKLAALSLVIVAANLAWLLFGAGFARTLSRPAIGRAVNIAFAILLVASVALALLAPQ